MRLESENKWKLLVGAGGGVCKDSPIVEREEEVIFTMVSCKGDQKDMSTPVILWLPASSRRQGSAAKNAGAILLEAESQPFSGAVPGPQPVLRRGVVATVLPAHSCVPTMPAAFLQGQSARPGYRGGKKMRKTASRVPRSTALPVGEGDHGQSSPQPVVWADRAERDPSPPAQSEEPNWRPLLWQCRLHQRGARINYPVLLGEAKSQRCFPHGIVVGTVLPASCWSTVVTS
ncbi:trans-sialidase, putative [Trypanosoma cruzi marinkellei]|uniref:Trans-sialidase, putative n=1 Tax=Trypanosoma cruzi marinkellei TaxID=85056 RepID=K2MT05_TRYCR|nr:trans-sialidase, putative [Trypanosoma cruzi marinkellei]